MPESSRRPEGLELLDCRMVKQPSRIETACGVVAVERSTFYRPDGRPARIIADAAIVEYRPLDDAPAARGLISASMPGGGEVERCPESMGLGDVIATEDGRRAVVFAEESPAWPSSVGWSYTFAAGPERPGLAELVRLADAARAEAEAEDAALADPE